MAHSTPVVGCRAAPCTIQPLSANLGFSRFKEQLELTDGNLGAQLRPLEDNGYIALRRAFVERKPVTWYRLSAAGRKALDKHLRALQDVIAVAGP